MSVLPSPSPDTLPADTAGPFRSLAEMRDAHADLLDAQDTSGESPDFAQRIRAFLSRASATGRLLERRAERSSAQTILDYWNASLHRLDSTAPRNVNLEPFASAPAAEGWVKPPCPYPDFATYSAENARFFAGRERLALEWNRLLDEKRLLAIYGPAGCGKHSLVHAGMIATLRAGGRPGSERWRYLQVNPGPNPLERLYMMAIGAEAEATVPAAEVETLRRHPERLAELLGPEPALVMVDRFEEIFLTRCSEADRAAFAANLAYVSASKEGHRVLIVLQQNRLEDTKRLPGLGPLLSSGAAVGLPPLTAEELREVIVRPAAFVGVTFEADLVDEIVADVASEPAALTLLQFALARLWDTMEGPRITRRAYRELGGAARALQTTADNLHDQEFDTAERDAMRCIFLRLVQADAAGGIVTQGATREELLDDVPASELPTYERVLARLLEVRLLRMGSVTPQIRVSHEGLIVRWPKLLAWVNEKRDEDIDRARLSSAARQWKESGRDVGALWRGVLLEGAARHQKLTPLEKEFVAASRQRARQRQLVRRRLIITGYAVGLLIVLGLTGSLLLNRARLAEMFVERGDRLIAENDPAGATLWYARAWRKDNRLFGTRPEIHQSRLGEAMRHTPRLDAQWERGPVHATQATADGAVFATVIQGARGMEVHWWAMDLSKGKSVQPGEIRTTPVGESVVNSLALSPDAAWLATTHRTSGGGQDRLKLWQADGNGPPREKTFHGAVNQLKFSPDSKHLAIAVGGGAERQAEVHVWSVSGETMRSFPSELQVNSVEFSPQSDWLVIACGDPTSNTRGAAIIWNFGTGKVVHLPQAAAVNYAEFRPGYGLKPNPGEETPAAPAQPGNPSSSLWDPQAGGDDSPAIRQLLDLGTPAIYFQRGSGSAITRTRVIPTGAQVADSLSRKESARHAAALQIITAAGGDDSGGPGSSASQGEARVWNAQTGEPITLPLQHKASVRSAAFSPDGRRVVTASADGTARLWDIDAGYPIATLPHQGWVNDARFSPDGQLVVTGSRDRLARVWEAATGRLVMPPLNHEGTVSRVSFTNDGRRVIVTSRDFARLWEVATTFDPPLLLDPEKPVQEVAASGDGNRLLTVGQDRAVRVWNVDEDTALAPAVTCPGAPRAAAMDHDGTRFAIACDPIEGKGGGVHVWDVLKTEGDPAALKRRQTTFDPAGAVSHLAFAPDDPQLLLTISRSGSSTGDTVEIWNSGTGTKLATIQPNIAVDIAIFTPADSKGQRWVVTGGGTRTPPSGEARFWDAATGKPAGEPMKHAERVIFLDLSKDGKQLATASVDDTANVWSVPGGKQLAVVALKGLHTADVAQARFSPDGRLLLTASFDCTAAIVPWRTWREGRPAILLPHRGSVQEARFSPSGRRVLTASADGLATIWDTESGTAITRLRHQGEMRSAAFRKSDDQAFLLGMRAIQPSEMGSMSSVAPTTPVLRVEARLWNLARDAAPTRLQGVAEAIATRTVDTAGHMTQLKSAEISRLWREGASEYLARFRPTSPVNVSPGLSPQQAEALQHHLREAALCEAGQRWFAAGWHLKRALQATPDDRKLLRRCARASDEQQRWAESNDLYTRALAVWPDTPEAVDSRKDLLIQRAWARIELKKWSDAQADCDLLIQLGPADYRSWMLRARVAVEQIHGKPAAEETKMLWQRAIADLRKSVELARKLPTPWQRLAAVLLRSGDVEGYRKTCEEIVQEFATAEAAPSRYVWPLVLSPDPGVDLRQYLPAVREEIKGAANSYPRLNTFGALLCRLAAPKPGPSPDQPQQVDIAMSDDAIRILRASARAYVQARTSSLAAGGAQSVTLQTTDYPEGRPQDWLFLAMAYHQIGRTSQAQRFLRAAQSSIEAGTDGIGIDARSARRSWSLLELEILLDEVKGLLGTAQ